MADALILPPKTHVGEYPIDVLALEIGDCMPVYDPTGQFNGVFTPLQIPWEAIDETEGFHRFLLGQGPAPSLCILHQSGKCRAQNLCNQVHADPAMVAVVRDNCSSGFGGLRQVCCCRYHIDPSCKLEFPRNTPTLVMVTFAGAHVVIPLERTDKTVYLDRLLGQALLTGAPRVFFQMSYVCRLHQKRRCGYSTQCGHVHMCREYWLQLFAVYPWLNCEPDPSNRALTRGVAGQQVSPEVAIPGWAAGGASADLGALTEAEALLLGIPTASTVGGSSSNSGFMAGSEDETAALALAAATPAARFPTLPHRSPLSALRQHHQASLLQQQLLQQQQSMHLHMGMLQQQGGD
eukprot:RCo008639